MAITASQVKPAFSRLIQAADSGDDARFPEPPGLSAFTTCVSAVAAAHRNIGRA
jgi:hypothetical protein